MTMIIKSELYVTLYGSLDSIDELEAVNDILESIGESPVSSLDDSGDVDIANARRILARENKRIQSKGWTFNIELSFELLPDSFSGKIKYLPQYLSLLSSGGTTIYVNRGGYVYDTSNKTDRFTNAIIVDLIRARTFSEMPECFREWIVASSAKRFNMGYFGDTNIDQELTQRIIEAKIDCNNYETDFGRYNMMEDSYVQDLLQR